MTAPATPPSESGCTCDPDTYEPHRPWCGIAPATPPSESVAVGPSATGANPTAVTKHKHEWQPNGTVEIDMQQCSPVSRWDDALWTAVVSIAVCKCGTTKRTTVGTKNERRRGDDLRRGR